MNPLLLILNPRRIMECVGAIDLLPIDKVWLTGYTERQLEQVIPDVVDQAHEYTHLLAIADDCMPTMPALMAVLSLVEDFPVVTGYCNLDSSGDGRVNITKTKLLEPLGHGSYDFWTERELVRWPSDRVPTTFAGFCLTAMPRRLWQHYPFQCIGEQGWASDYSLSMRLQRDAIPIVAHRAAKVHHVKETWSAPDQEHRKRLLIGEIPAAVTWSPAAQLV